jgi:replicative DNA helicase
MTTQDKVRRAKTRNPAPDPVSAAGAAGEARRTAPPADPAGSGTSDLVRNIPPHSIEAEQAVLGGALLQPDSLFVLVDMLTEEDFYLPAHRCIFGAFRGLFQRGVPVDLISTAEYLKGATKLEEAGGAVYLSELSASVHSAANAEYYASLVRDKAMARQLINVCAGIIGESYAPGADVPSLLDNAEQRVMAVSGRNAARSWKDTRELTRLVFDDLENRRRRDDPITGVSTGYRRLDYMTSGLQPADLIILAARPSMGKTALALNMAMRAAVRLKTPVQIYSLEMSQQQLMARMLCSWAKVDVQRMRAARSLTDEDWMSLHDAGEIFYDAPIYIDDSASLSTMQMRARTRRLKAEKNIGLVVIDYLQLMQSSRRTDSREQEISDISRNLKAMAKELNIPVLALSQLNREVDKRQGEKRRPMLSDLRESGAIEQDADVIMFIHRDAAYAKHDERPPIDKAEIVIGKQRNGPVGIVELMYAPAYTSFEEMENVHAPAGM